MHAARVFRKIDAQHRFYSELRQRFRLAAQPAIRVIGKVADAYAVLHATIDAPEAPLAEPVNGFVGVDMGIVNIATTSTGSRASGAPLNR